MTAMETPLLSPDERRAAERIDVIAGLRELADWLEANPAIPVHSYGSVCTADFDVYVDYKDTLLDVIHSGAGPFEKVYQGSNFELARKFGKVKYSINVHRAQVCEKVKVGERTVAAVPEHVEDIYEWECIPLLGE